MKRKPASPRVRQSFGRTPLVLIGFLFAWSFAASVFADGGDVDPSFNPGPSGGDIDVGTIALQPDGKIIYGGVATFYPSSAHKYIARANSDGSLDTNFDSGLGPNDAGNTIPFIGTITLQPDGKILVGGDFRTFNGTLHRGVIRLNSNGSPDPTFDTGDGAYGGTSRVDKIALQPDGKIILAGGFTGYNGASRIGIARLNTNGVLDATFDPGTGATQPEFGVGPIFAMALQPDGKIVIGGVFTKFNGTDRNHIARLNSNGSVDMTFNPGTGTDANTFGNGPYVFTIALQPDGKIIIGGYFTSYNGTPMNRIARLNADGSLDATFNPVRGVENVRDPGGENSVRTTTLQPDGRIIIGGGFET